MLAYRKKTLKERLDDVRSTLFVVDSPSSSEGESDRDKSDRIIRILWTRLYGTVNKIDPDIAMKSVEKVASERNATILLQQQLANALETLEWYRN